MVFRNRYLRHTSKNNAGRFTHLFTRIVCPHDILYSDRGFKLIVDSTHLPFHLRFRRLTTKFLPKCDTSTKEFSIVILVDITGLGMSRLDVEGMLMRYGLNAIDHFTLQAVPGIATLPV